MLCYIFGCHGVSCSGLFPHTCGLAERSGGSGERRNLTHALITGLWIFVVRGMGTAWGILEQAAPPRETSREKALSQCVPVRGALVAGPAARVPGRYQWTGGSEGLDNQC